MKQITYVELNQLLTNGNIPSETLIDVREVGEYQMGHVPGAINIPLSTLDKNINSLKKGTEYHIICQSGGRSLNACVYLKQHGIDVVNVQGGTGAYGSQFELEK